MFRKAMIAMGAASLVLAAQPLRAQDSTATADEAKSPEKAMEMLGAMFKAEPLTPEQEARVPLAQQVVDKMIPPGTYGEVMGSMFNKILGPIMSKIEQPSSAEVARQIGAMGSDLALDKQQAAEASALLDPAWQERRKVQMDAIQGALTKAMSAIEPTMRKAMAEVYAADFDSAQMTDIGAFFSTESGQAFARKSMTIASDPRFLSAMMKSLPQMLGSFASMEQEVKAATVKLPPMRTWNDLSAADRARLSELTGLSQAKLKAGMETADEDRAAKSAAGQSDGNDN